MQNKTSMSRWIWFSISKLTCANLKESEDSYLKINTFLQMKEAYLSTDAELRRCFEPGLLYICVLYILHLLSM
jgi:hypothetical protein